MKHAHRLLIAGLVVSALALAVALTVIAAVGQDSLALNGTTYYVDADATGLPDGMSWGTAFTTLQPALEAAVSGDQIWVAEGTYTPTAEHGGSGDRYKSFQMVNGVAIYGGFDPTVGHTEWEHRDWVAHPTILSGDLNGDDIPPFTNNDENSYHVFYHPQEYTDLDSSAILDGFTISGGNADLYDASQASPYMYGGGLYNWSSSPTLTNCTFAGNWAYMGGGMLNRSSAPTLIDCTFSDNSVVTSGWWGAGGGILNMSSAPTLTNCTFSENHGGGGGGMHNDGSSPVLANCTFSGNSANVGGGMYNWSSAPALTNCTFSGNSADYYGGGMINYSGSTPTLTNCILWGDSPEEIYNSDEASVPDVSYSDVQGGCPGDGNIDENPLFVNPDNGDFHLHSCSRCIDAGNNAAPQLPLYDFEGDDRILDGDGDGTPIVDMGVDEVVDGLPCLRIYLPVVLRNY